MGNDELKTAATILRKNNIFPVDIRRANSLVAQSGVRVNDINVALYWAEKGDMTQAKAAAGRAATAISRLIQ
ncbi:MAG: hypothetical protein PHP89_05370 [Candidatus Omnitrophica bacterium]|nr:hypothetical protein [Candidatus Omnitrophota bacterium]